MDWTLLCKLYLPRNGVDGPLSCEAGISQSHRCSPCQSVCPPPILQKFSLAQPRCRALTFAVLPAMSDRCMIRPLWRTGPKRPLFPSLRRSRGIRPISMPRLDQSHDGRQPPPTSALGLRSPVSRRRRRRQPRWAPVDRHSPPNRGPAPPNRPHQYLSDYL